METREVIGYLTSLCNAINKYNGNFYGYINSDMLLTTISALEKQMEKKPNRSRYGVIHCPNCCKGITGTGNYCWNCGQKIDWSEKLNCPAHTYKTGQLK